jgi:hypothetical protein
MGIVLCPFIGTDRRHLEQNFREVQNRCSDRSALVTVRFVDRYTRRRNTRFA